MRRLLNLADLEFMIYQMFDMLFDAEDRFQRKVHMNRLDPLSIVNGDVVLVEVKLVREDERAGQPGPKWRTFRSRFEVHSVSRLFACPQPPRVLPDEHFLWGM